MNQPAPQPSAPPPSAGQGNVRAAPAGPHVPRELLALLQLGGRARAAENLAALGFILVNETHQLFEYRQASFWLNGSIATVSGVPQVESNAPYVQWLRVECQTLWQGR